jgi:NitT/TauT family transport system ATP-binding protein
VAIVVSHLDKAYGEKIVLRDFSAVFPRRQCTCIMGDSGLGKTTLLHIMMGLTPADAGSVAGLENRRISAVFQEDRLCESFNSVANVRFACQRPAKQQIIRHLAAVGLAGSLDQPVREFSGGMRRRVAVVRAILAGGEVLFMDEPLKGLDDQSRAVTADYILSHTREATVIVVTHSHEEAALLRGTPFYLREGMGK